MVNWKVLRKCMWMACLFTLLFYLLQLSALIVRFMEFPNYVNVHNWFVNVMHIFNSTPSMKDALFVAKDEWLMEVGYMNFDFGKGISEWSLFIAPANVFLVFIVGVIAAANIRFLMITREKQMCSKGGVTANAFISGLGATFFSLTSITMSWVVCCSTPTWVVGLAILGVGVTTSLWLEPIGLWLNVLGIVLLVALLGYQYRLLRKFA